MDASKEFEQTQTNLIDRGMPGVFARFLVYL